MASFDPSRLVPKPEWVEPLERRVASVIPIGPNAISAIKLVVIAPLLFLALRQVEVMRAGPAAVVGLFVAFFALDYLDGVVARARGLTSQFGRVFDRATDYPLLMILSYFCIDLLPGALLAAKIAVDVLLLVLYVLGRGSTENRLRTAISYTTVLALLLLSQGWLPRLVTPIVVEYLLWTSIAFSATVALNNLGILQKRFIADALSASNLVCGVFSMVFAARGRLDISLLFLILGAAFDGFDGAAARRWGGTRWGVYSDDIADGVNYGVAPGAAIVFALGGLEGWVTGVSFAIFTIGRLVFFTLRKGDGDPGIFAGVPSTVGGLVVLCALILFPSQPALVGVMVGMACTLMVSFATHYRHLGRTMARSRRALWGASGYAICLVAGTLVFGKTVPVAIILATALGYGFLPTALAFTRAIRARRLSRSPANRPGRSELGRPVA